MAIFLSLGVLASLLLIGGGLFGLRRGERKRPVLMIVAGLVILGNVYLYSQPLPAPRATAR